MAGSFRILFVGGQKVYSSCLPPDAELRAVYDVECENPETPVNLRKMAFAIVEARALWNGAGKIFGEAETK
jgi:hypothetical protein